MTHLYHQTVYTYTEAPPELRALFPDRTGDHIVIISGVETMEGGQYGFWVVVPDSLLIGIWDIFAYVHKAYGARGERVFLLIEKRVQS